MRGSPLSAALGIAILAGVFGVPTVYAEDISRLTVVESGGRTKALIEVPDSVEYSVFELSKPNRLVLDLHNSRFARGFAKPGPNGVVSNIRTGQPSPGEARVVFDLSTAVRTRTYFAHGGVHAQLVIELSDGKNAPTDAIDKSGIDQTSLDAPVPVEASLSAAMPPSAAPAGEQKLGEQKISDTVTAIETAPPRSHLDTSKLRRENPKVAPPVSTAVIVPGKSAGEAATVVVRADAQAVSSASIPGESIADAPTPKHHGARTVHDLFGARQRKLVIAIDAGHGGQDCGARGYSGSLEKNITLATARELARQINAEPGMQAVLTRDGDYFVPLAERYHKAREAKADLFISIHADADPTHTATGSSVWVLSQRGVTSQAARWLADRENAADLIGGVSLSDKDNTLASVLLDLSQSATMKASDDAAERVHQALRDIGRTHKSHPERANFVVLRSPDVPSMLVETAFITNPGEEQNLNDPGYRSRLAAAITGGVHDYFSANPLPGTIFAREETPASTPLPVQIARADTSAATREHIVKRGESLSDIADEYGVSVHDLRSANDISGLRVRPGTRLAIPMRGAY